MFITTKKALSKWCCLKWYSDYSGVLWGEFNHPCGSLPILNILFCDFLFQKGFTMEPSMFCMFNLICTEKIIFNVAVLLQAFRVL